MERRLLIINESYRRVKTDHPIPAMDRFTGVYFEVLKKTMREYPGETRDLDVLILTKEGGLYRSDENVPYLPALDQDYRHSSLRVDPSIKDVVLKKLLKAVQGKKYSEVFVNMGADYRSLIEGFEEKAGMRIEYAKGPGLGPKAGEMKRWLLSEKRFYA